ncbi:MAG: hypothetical protein WBA51_14200 [Erythrobacter sp.]
MTIISLRQQASNFVLAIALVTGTAMVAGHIVPDEAHAQRKKKDKKEKAPKAEYSEAFIAAYNPAEEALKVEGVDIATVRPQLDALIPVSVSPDEQIAAGGLIYNAGVKSSDRGLQLQGMELMLSSGKVASADAGRYNFIAYQIANNLKDYAKARKYLQAAIDSNFTTETVGISDLQIAMAESYFSNDENMEGLDYLQRAIEGRKSKGEAVEEAWYRRGITVAYNNEIEPQVYDMALAWVADYPSAKNWRDAINLARNLNTYEGAEMLDLLRLSRKVDALQDKIDYVIYVESADARRLPKEVKDVIEQAYAADAVSRDDIFVAESLETANSRIASDRADLPALERDAMAADAGLRTVVAAGSAFLSYGEYDKAVTFYTKALGMPGVDANEALTRLGIAQIGTGDYAAAKESFAKITGNRVPIAKLWTGYAVQQTGGATAGESGASPSEQMGG